MLHLSNAYFGCCCRYFARMNKNAISIYEAPDMGLLDKKSLKLDAVQV